MILALVGPRESRRRLVSTLALYVIESSREVSIAQGTNVVVSRINYFRVIPVFLCWYNFAPFRYPRETISLQVMRSEIRAKVCFQSCANICSLIKTIRADCISRDVVIRHEKSFHRLENPRRQPPPPPTLQPSSPDADVDPEPFADTIVVNSHNHHAEFQLPIKSEHQETPEMQSTLDPLLREHDAQLAGHSSSSVSHMNGHIGPSHGFQQYQNGFIDPALDISDIFGTSPNLIARPWLTNYFISNKYKRIYNSLKRLARYDDITTNAILGIGIPWPSAVWNYTISMTRGTC